MYKIRIEDKNGKEIGQRDASGFWITTIEPGETGYGICNKHDGITLDQAKTALLYMAAAILKTIPDEQERQARKDG